MNRVRSEILIVLAVTFGMSGLRSLLRLVDGLLNPAPLSEQSVTLNASQSDLAWLDIALQLCSAGVLFAWGALALFLLQEEAARNAQGVFPIAHHARAGALAHEQLACRKQGRFARARLAREHRQPRARRKRGVADKRQILNMDFIDHELRAFLFVALPFAAFFPVSIPVVIP